eukprot:6182492-Pleurochrysis_carterae.AAC.5
MITARLEFVAAYGVLAAKARSKQKKYVLVSDDRSYDLLDLTVRLLSRLRNPNTAANGIQLLPRV